MFLFIGKSKVQSSKWNLGRVPPSFPLAGMAAAPGWQLQHLKLARERYTAGSYPSSTHTHIHSIHLASVEVID
jgi:hypothetical protein